MTISKFLGTAPEGQRLRALSYPAWISLLYFALVVPLAKIKLLWADELLTFYISQQGSVRGIMHAVAEGADPNPPLTHLLVLAATRLFGNGEMAIRLIAVLAGWIAVIGLYAFLQKRLPRIYAAIGCCFLMASGAFNYTFETRPYALTLGFSILSLLCWRKAITTKGIGRIVALGAMTLTLALGLCCSYFAVLALFPIAAGELMRWRERQRPDLTVWMCLGASLAPLWLFAANISRAIHNYVPHAWNRVTINFLGDAYGDLLEALTVPLSLLVPLCVYLIWKQRPENEEDVVWPDAERAAIVALSLYPVIAYGIAVARAGMVSPRHVLPVVFGFSILFASCLYRVSRETNPRYRWLRKVLAPQWVLILMVAWCISRTAVIGVDYYQQRQSFEHVQASLPAYGKLAVSDSLLNLPLYYYSSKQVKQRLVFPLDFDAIHRFKGEDSLEENFSLGHDVFPVPIVDLDTISDDDTAFLITTDDSWILKEFAQEGRRFERLPVNTQSSGLHGIFTPVCHKEVTLYEVQDSSNDLLVARARRELLGIPR